MNYKEFKSGDVLPAAKVNEMQLAINENLEAINNITGVEVVNNLTSTDTDKALSANQGKVLKDELDEKQNQFAKRMFNNTTGKNYLNEQDIKEGYYGGATLDWNIFYSDSSTRSIEIELESGTYTMSATVDNTTVSFKRYAINGVITNVSGDHFTFTLNETSKLYITWNTPNHTYVNMKTMIELGTKVTEYEPYIPVPGTSNMSFITPEQFGAKGDNVTNDLEALNKCIQHAIDNNEVVRADGSYFIANNTLNLNISNLNIYINRIRSTSTDCCVKLQGSNNIITINNIYSNGNGFVISTDESHLNSNSNYIFIKSISAANHCFYKYSHDNTIRITYNIFNFLVLGSDSGDCIRDYGGGGNNIFNGNDVYCYAPQGHGIYLKNIAFSLYKNFAFEQDVKYGVICEDCTENTFENMRTGELGNEIRETSNDRYVIKFVGNSYGNQFKSPTPYIAVKNEVNTFNTEGAQQKYQNTYFSECIKYNGTNTIKMSMLQPYEYTELEKDWRLFSGVGEIITYYNHTGVKLEHDVLHDIEVVAYTPYTTDNYIPTIFNIKENTTITLNDMYFPFGISKIAIVQNDNKKAIVKDRHGNTIFDGSNKEDGRYELECIVEENDTTTAFFMDCFCFTGENDKWVEISNKSNADNNSVGKQIGTGNNEIFNDYDNNLVGKLYVLDISDDGTTLNSTDYFNAIVAKDSIYQFRYKKTDKTTFEFVEIIRGIVTTNSTLNNSLVVSDGTYNYVYTLVKKDGIMVKTTKLIDLTEYGQEDVFAHIHGETNVAYNIASSVEGVGNIVGGKASHVEGHMNIAIAEYSHAEGRGNQSTGKFSHVEGQENIVSGVASHAEGYDNQSINSYTHTEGSGNIASGTHSHAEGINNNVSGNYSHVEGYMNEVTKDSAHAEGRQTKATGINAHAENYATEASGENTHAEGNAAKAIGAMSHAEGYDTKTIGEKSHAEGEKTIASGDMAHAEGQGSTASGRVSHAEGYSTEANGVCSHAQGEKTIANGDYQHVEGRYNVEDTTNKYVHIVGNGNNLSNVEKRSNAHTIDWDGNVWFSGDIKVGGISYDDENAKEIATKEYVDNKMGTGNDLELIGQTPVTLSEDTDIVVLSSEEECNYTIQSITLVDYETATVAYNKASKTTNSDYIEITTSSDATAWYQSYANITLSGLTAGEQYTLYIDALGLSTDTTNHITSGYFTVFASDMTEIQSGIYLDSNTKFSLAITPTTESIIVRWYVADSASFVANCKARINSIYINKGTENSNYSSIINLSGTFTGKKQFSNIGSGAVITATPACSVYSKEVEKESKPLSGKTVVCFGDSLFGLHRGETSATSYIAEETGATVYNVGFGGCRMAQHPSTGYNEFCMYALSDAIYNENWTTQDNAVASGVDYFAEQLNTLKSIDFNKVDIAVIHYGTNDFGGDVVIGKDDLATTTTTLCGAMRHSVENLLKKYPKLKIAISLPVYRYWTVDNTITYSETYTNTNGNKLTDFVSAIADVAKEYNLPIVDCYYGLGINKINASTFLEDGTHHNIDGRKRFGEYIGKKLISDV